MNLLSLEDLQSHIDHSLACTLSHDATLFDLACLTCQTILMNTLAYVSFKPHVSHSLRCYRDQDDPTVVGIECLTCDAGLIDFAGDPDYDALLQADEDEATLDCGCLLRREYNDGSISLTYCDIHRAVSPTH